MVAYQNPQAQQMALLGRQPTAEEIEISGRLLTQGIPQIPNQVTGAPLPPSPSPQPRIAEGPQPNIPPAQPNIPPAQPNAVVTPKSMEQEILANWALINGDKKVTWDENTTWNEYLGEVFEKKGKDAVDKIILEQIKIEALNTKESGKSTEPGLQVMPTIPLTEQGIAAALPQATGVMGAVSPTEVAETAETIIGAARGGLIKGYFDGGFSDPGETGDFGDDPGGPGGPGDPSDPGGPSDADNDTGTDVEHDTSIGIGPVSVSETPLSAITISPDQAWDRAVHKAGLSPEAVVRAKSMGYTVDPSLGLIVDKEGNPIGTLSTYASSLAKHTPTLTGLAAKAVMMPVGGLGSLVAPTIFDTVVKELGPKAGIPEPFTTPLAEYATRVIDEAIKSKAEGGLVKTFNEGGMNVPSIDPDEFEAFVGKIAAQEDIPKESIDMVEEVATETTGINPANDNVMDSGIMQNVEEVEITEPEQTGIGSLQELNDKLVASGQEGLIHASPGEIVFDPNILPPEQKQMVLAALDAANIDINKMMVGDPSAELNKLTGLPAYGFFSSIGKFFKKAFKKVKRGVKKVGKFLKKNAGTILGIAGAMTGQPWLAALGSGIGSLIEGKPIQSALIRAGLSFAGTEWVGPWIGEQLGGVSSAFKTPIGEIPGIASVVPSGQGTALAEGLATRALEKAATQEAATRAIAEAGIRGATSEAITNAAIEGAASSIADKAVAKTIGEKIAGDVISGALKSTAAAYSSFAPQVMGGSGLARLLATPVGGAIGGAAANVVGQQAVQPMIETMISGVPEEAQSDVMAEWNKRYNYTPSSQELYQFYATEYTKPEQLSVSSQLAGLPGYSPSTGILAVAGGGVINGIGGPKSDSNLARLSDGEFVFTADAVRGADPSGMGNRMRGAREMYRMMHNLEGRAA